MVKPKIEKADILIITGSASLKSSNGALMSEFDKLAAGDFNVTLYDQLGSLPHFDPSLTETLPHEVAVLLKLIDLAQGVIFCSPEYIFSIPARVKNLLEWCVSTTVFSDKPVGIITASADGKQAHAEMKLIMQTLGAKLSDDCQLIIPGIKSRFDEKGRLSDEIKGLLCDFKADFLKFTASLKDQLPN